MLVRLAYFSIVDRVEVKTNMDRGSLVENAVAKNDAHLLKKLLNEPPLDGILLRESYDVTSY